MNISNMMKEGEVSNLEWLDETNTFNPSNMGLTNVEEMKLQWDRDLKPETREKIVKRKVNELLNEGVLGRNVMSSVNKVFAKTNVPQNIKKYIKARSGVVGTVLVDCGVLNDGSDYLKSKKSSVFKGFHQYAINCKCDHKRKTAIPLEEINESGKGDIDGFLDAKKVKANSVKICSKTGLPVLVSADKYSSEDAVKVFGKLVKLGYITQNEKKTLLLKNNPLMAVKKAFNMMAEKSNLESAKKYSAPVDNTDFVMDKKGVFVDLEKDLKTPEIMDIGEKNIKAEIMSAEEEQDIELESKEVALNHKSENIRDDLDVDINKKESSLNLKRSCNIKNIDVKIGRKEKNLDFAELDGSGTAEVCGMCERMDVDVHIIPDQKQVDVEPESCATDLDMDDEFQDVEVDNEEAVDADWYDKREMLADPCGEEDFEYLDVEEDSKFEF